MGVVGRGSLFLGDRLAENPKDREDEDFCGTLFRKREEQMKVEKAEFQLNKEFSSGRFLSEQGEGTGENTGEAVWGP